METLPFRFGIVTGTFDCSKNNLTSLKWAPKEVGEDFGCDGNELTSLEGAPIEVGRNFGCRFNNLTSLEGAPKKVGEDFWCNNNKKLFTIEEVEAVSRVEKSIYV